MLNNDILRRLRYALKLNDIKLITCFSLGNEEVTQSEITDFLKKDTDEGFKSLHDKKFSHFLDGLITYYRGKSDQPKPQSDKSLNNNEILKKLRIALAFKDTDVIDTLRLADFTMSKSELNAMFRKKDHKHFKPCGDQVLRNFIIGLTVKNRSKTE